MCILFQRECVSMIITKEDNGDLKIEMQTDLDAAFWNNIKKDRATSEAQEKSLMLQVKILSEDNSYLKFMLDKSNIIYDKNKVDS